MKKRRETLQEIRDRCRKENERSSTSWPSGRKRPINLYSWQEYKDKARVLHLKPFRIIPFHTQISTRDIEQHPIEMAGRIYLGRVIGGYVIEGYTFRGRGSNAATFDTEPACFLSIKTIDRAVPLTEEELAEEVLFKTGLREAIEMRIKAWDTK